MTDNIDNKNLNESADTQSENHSNEVFPITDTEANIQNQNTETMEVHKHPRHIMHKKKWTEYLLEFLMLFLAVFLGFVAENIRENQADREREKQYIISLVNDLDEDTVTFTKNINDFIPNVKRLDTLMYLLSDPNIKNYGAELYYLGRMGSRGKTLALHDRTIQQMKNSGGFRLITNEKVANAILEYYNQLRFIDYLQSNELNEITEYRQIAITIFHPRIFDSMLMQNDSIVKPAGNPALLTYDSSALLHFAGIVAYIKSARQATMKNEKEMNMSAKNLIALLKKEYHLENE